MIRRLHHNACRCRDSEQTRKFYEDFLGLPLAGTLEIKETKSGRRTETLHTFYELGDGSYLAFFEAKGRATGIETRGISDHGFIHSIYFRDPNGYVIELTAKTPEHERAMDPALNGAREKLERWSAARKQRAATVS